MNRRRLVIAVASIAVPVALIVAACSFPETNIFDAAPEAGPDTSQPGDGGNTDGSSEGGSDAGKDSDVDPNGKDAEAGVVDASALDADILDSGTCCDCDNDGYEHQSALCDASTGIDCDDTIAAINPGASFVTNPIWPSKIHTTPFDWDCSNGVTKRFGHGLTCGGLVPPLCGGTEGFQDDPACGVSSGYYKCTGLFCGSSFVADAVQGCK